MMRSAGKVSLAVLASRILGLVRDQVFAACFGGSKLSSAYYMAFRIPNLLRDLFAEGALSAAFVTVFSRKKSQEGDSGAWTLARLTMTLQALILGMIVILGIVFAAQIVRVVAWGWKADPDQMELTVLLTRILFPYILFVGMAALVMGILNAYGRFGLPASASSFCNLGTICIGLSLALIFDPHFGGTAMICMAIGSLGGGILQWLVQVPALHHLGFRHRPEWNLQDRGLREIGLLMAPAVVGVSAVQVNVVINSIFASHPSMGDGAVAALAWAFRLIQLPIGMFGVAISTASLPALAVEATLQDREVFRDRVERGLRLNAALCIPAACGLALLATPLIAVLYQHGKFNPETTALTARILLAYTVGLIGYASIKVLAPAFYALNRAAIPMSVSLGSILTVIVLNWLFAFQLHLGPAGLALATSCSALLNAAILLVVLARLTGPIRAATWLSLGKILAASAIMCVGVVASQWLHRKIGVPHHFLGNLSRVVAGVGVGFLIYVLAARGFHLDEVLVVEDALRSRLGLKPRQ
jgi:putative peptidoglycan lipid II flippase